VNSVEAKSTDAMPKWRTLEETGAPSPLEVDMAILLNYLLQIFNWNQAVDSAPPSPS
jgi:hypothetical protein